MDGSLTLLYNVAGISGQALITRSADGGDPRDPVLAAAKAGSLTTRTDDNTGEATLATGHGILTGDVVDVYWSGGMRYGMTVGTVVGNAVPLDGGAGDPLPTAATALTVAKQQEITLNLVGNNLVMLLVHCPGRAHVDLQESGGTSHLAISLNANEASFWANNTGVANPIAGDTVAKVKASTAETSQQTLKLTVLKDSTP